MTEDLAPVEQATSVDIGEYCRRVEEHLARVNDGNLIRIVGPGFELVRGWALDGIPLSVAFHGIEMKAERHRLGHSRRPLRLEFCEIDVRTVFDDWRRAVGIVGRTSASSIEGTGTEAPADRRRPSLSAHLDRVLDRLSRAAGRLELSDAFRDAVGVVVEQVAELRGEVKSTRGSAREALVLRLPALDDAMVAAARREVGEEGLERLRAEAADELSAYRTRLSSDAWIRSVDLSTDRLLRDRLSLPTLTVEPSPSLEPQAPSPE